jgi:SAV_6107-like HEPN
MTSSGALASAASGTAEATSSAKSSATSTATSTARSAPWARRRGPTVPAALDLLALARHGLAEASLTPRPHERYAAAHLAALRTAAAVLAARARPADGTSRRRPRSAWVLLPEVAPELAEWAAFFAAGAGKRAAAEAGLVRAVAAREADDLLRDAETFLALVETTLGLPHQQALSPSAPRAS